eukprot:238987_1
MIYLYIAKKVNLSVEGVIFTLFKKYLKRNETKEFNKKKKELLEYNKNNKNRMIKIDQLEILRNVLYPTVVEENKIDVDTNDINIDEKEDKNDNVDENVMLYCICRKPYVEGEEMIACDDCSEYYHRICIGMSAEMFQELVDDNAFQISQTSQLSK